MKDPDPAYLNPVYLTSLLKKEWNFLRFKLDPGTIPPISPFFSSLDPKSRTGQVIIGSLLGDGHITRKGSFQESHCWAQQELVFELSRLLHPLFLLSDSSLARWKRSKNKGPLPGVWSSPGRTIHRNHPEEPPRHNFKIRLPILPSFKELRKLWYPLGKKVVPESIPDLIGPQALAWWYLGDGSHGTSSPTLCTMGFSRDENLRLISSLDCNLDIASRLCSRNMIHISPGSRSGFFHLILPYIPLTMAYKVGHTPYSLAYCYNPRNYDPEVIIPKTSSPGIRFPIEYTPRIRPSFSNWLSDPRILHWLKESRLDSNRSILIALKNP
jgi:hypothetical protein